jgi:hypothetical protein
MLGQRARESFIGDLSLELATGVLGHSLMLKRKSCALAWNMRHNYELSAN